MISIVKEYENKLPESLGELRFILPAFFSSGRGQIHRAFYLRIGRLPASQRALRQEQRTATSAAERGEYLDVVSVRLRNDTFQHLFRNVAVQSAVLVGIAECDIYMRELSEIELAERLIVSIGKVPDYPVRSFALSC